MRLKWRLAGLITVCVLLITLRPATIRGLASFSRKAVEPAAHALSAGPQSGSPADAGQQSEMQIQSRDLRIEFNKELHSRVVARFGGKDLGLGPFSTSETVRSLNQVWKDFSVESTRHNRVDDSLGSGEQLLLTGKSGVLGKTVSVTIYDEFPTLAVFDVVYKNLGPAKLQVLGWTNNAYVVDALGAGTQPAFWSYQSGSYEKRPDWVLPLHAGFSQQNFQGMNASDYGGGTPIADVWRRDVGIGVGHLDPRPRLVSLPVSMPDSRHARLAMSFDKAMTLQPGEEFRTLRTFVTVHQGDYFRTLVTYRRFMMKQGFQMASAPESAFGPIWCAWGYGRTMQPKQFYGTLPTAKAMGFTWVTLDDGWQNNVGDWAPNRKKFPNGDADMKALVDRVHKDGFLAQLWWSPLSAVPDSQLLKERPDLVLKNSDGSSRKISWWNSDYLCPADPRVVEYHKALVRKILGEWGFDGLKLDGQHMNGVPACYNPAHHHKNPEDAVEALPDFFRELYETARSVKPNALVEFCPCGTSFSFFTMPHYNMSVASDPTSSFQVRSKGKTLKGLMGDGIAYFGDHVELSDGGDDFASTLGVGGVVGTQFVLAALAEKPSKLDLTAARQQEFEKWIKLYREKMLSRGEYRGELYDIGFDRPEAHAIAKDQRMYYAFYAPHWKGTIELRGLEDRSYRITDYVSSKDLGVVHGPSARLPVEFNKHLLLAAAPE
jgi:alpha-galactosidase